jgi:hypothetical protein
MRVAFLGLVLAASFGSPAGATEPDALRRGIEVCSQERDTDVRLKCFDLIAQIVKDGESQADKTAKTSDVLKPATPTEYRRVDSDDIHVAPRKFQGKGVELAGARCYHADLDEYRCLGAGSLPVIVFAPAITPSDAKAQIENDCGEVKKMATSAKCRKVIRFVPLKISQDDIGGAQKRSVILAETIEIVPAPARGKRR